MISIVEERIHGYKLSQIIHPISTQLTSQPVTTLTTQPPQLHRDVDLAPQGTAAAGHLPFRRGHNCAGRGLRLRALDTDAADYRRQGRGVCWLVMEVGWLVGRLFQGWGYG